MSSCEHMFVAVPKESNFSLITSLICTLFIIGLIVNLIEHHLNKKFLNNRKIIISYSADRCQDDEGQNHATASQ